MIPEHTSQLLCFQAKGRTVQPKKVDHVMEILKMEYREPEINQLAQVFPYGTQALHHICAHAHMSKR